MRKVAGWRCVLAAAVWAAGVAGDLLPVIPVVVACQMDTGGKGELAAARVPRSARYGSLAAGMARGTSLKGK